MRSQRESASSLRAILVIGDSANVRTGPEVALTGLWRYLLLIDVVVPDEGPELADQVQTASPTTKILLMSGYHPPIVRCVVPQRDTKP